MLTSSVRRDAENYDAQFAWVLEVRGIPSECTDIRWEQFVSGGFTLHFSDGTTREYAAVTLMQRVNPSARRFGDWSDDVLREMTPGPRQVDRNYNSATCAGGTLRRLANAPATMRGASANPGGSTYRFEDSPGFDKDFDDVINGKPFVGITWNCRFEHKLWRSGENQPFFVRIVTLSGRHDRTGVDTRRVV